MGESIVLPWLTGLAEVAPSAKKRNPKRTGELSEAAFLLKAESMGFRVAKPWGDSEKYDFILDSGERLWRVQLKSTSRLHARGYEVQPIYGVYGEGKVGYTADDIDVLVVHIRPCDAWYVLPVEAFVGCKTLRFYPDIACKAARWEEYRAAWDLIGGVESVCSGEARLWQ
jgi:PD-(D/E)XK endonuclease